jgi:hypothetical protein
VQRPYNFCTHAFIQFYPITNSVPLNFEFQFLYQKESHEISINPLEGVIPANETLTVEITFMPTSKCTSTAEVFLQIQQFDFQPIPIRIIGSGIQKVTLNQSKRIKSSRLAPLKEGEEGRKTPQPLLKRRPSGEQSSSMSLTQNQMGVSGTMNLAQTGNISMKRAHIRTSYPKLMNAKRTIVEDESKTMNPAKIAEREYLNRFTRIQELDKEK